MKEVMISIDKKLAKRIRKEITTRYGSKKNFAKIIHLRNDEIQNGLKERKISVRKLCYILYNLSLTTYDVNKNGWALINAKKNIDNADIPQWEIENSSFLAIRSLSSAFSKKELTETIEQALEKKGYYSEYKFPNNPQDWYTDIEYGKVRDIFIYALNQLGNSNLYSLYNNLKTYIEINDVYWQFICLVQNLREIDIMYLEYTFRNFYQYKNLQSEMFKNVKKVSKADIDIYDNKGRKAIIDECVEYFNTRYSDDKERFNTLYRLLPKIPYILYMDSADWKLLYQFSELVNENAKFPYKLPIAVLKLIEGFIKGVDRSKYYVDDTGIIFRDI